MKQPINEIKRMQQLAGLINEGQDVEEGIGKAIGTAALVGASLFSPETTVAQSPQGIERAAQTEMTDTEAGYKLWHAYTAHRTAFDLENLSSDVFNLIADADEYNDLPVKAAKRLGHAAKKDPAAMEIINTSEMSLRKTSKDAIDAAKERGYGRNLEETVNEALRRFRKGK